MRNMGAILAKCQFPVSILDLATYKVNYKYYVYMSMMEIVNCFDVINLLKCLLSIRLSCNTNSYSKWTFTEDS